MTAILETVAQYPKPSSRTDRQVIDVTIDVSLVNLPLRTLGLPAHVFDWLIDAGISTSPPDRAAIRRGFGSEAERREIVLFDSRNASARIDAEAAESLGYLTIDAARLLVDRNAPDAAQARRGRFFEALRAAIERAGGMWLRLADFPHPYRWAVCEGGSEAEVARLAGHPRLSRAMGGFGRLGFGDSPEVSPASGDFLRRCRLAGRPVHIARSHDSVGGWEQSSEMIHPLSWRTTLGGFGEWWRWRGSLTLTVVRHGRTTELTLIRSDQRAPRETWQPAIEVWRGRHCAIVPFEAGSLTIHDDALPFQKDSDRGRAGFLAMATEANAIRTDHTSLTAAS